MEKRKDKGLVTPKSRVMVLVLVFVVAISIVMFMDKIMEYNQIQDQKASVKESIEDKQEEIDELEYQYDAPMDDEYIESVAKSELDLVNPDDIIVYKDVDGKKE